MVKKPTKPAPAPKKAAPKVPAKVPAQMKPQGELQQADDIFFNTGFGTGLENVTAADLLIPRLTIIQKSSPQVDQNAPEFNKDARVGDCFDTGVNELFKEGIHIIPVHYVRQWLEWYPRKAKKGLAAIHDTPDILEKCKRDEKNRPVLANGNYVAETAQFYLLNISAGFRKSFLPMASTQLKKARRLLTLATNEKLVRADGTEFTPPLFYRTYKLTGSNPESNAEGNWMGWTVERDVALDELPNWRNLMLEIKSFRESLTKGDIRGDIAAMAEEAGATIDHEAGVM